MKTKFLFSLTCLWAFLGCQAQTPSLENSTPLSAEPDYYYSPSSQEFFGALLSWKVPYPRPGALSQADLESYQRSLKSADLYTDSRCKLDQEDIESTVLQISSKDREVCKGRHQQLIWLESTQGLYVCENGQIASAMRSAIGRGGLGKEKEGDNKNPVGSYWLGLPRPSERFGFFIPVGYPNKEDVKAGRTGHSIGIHGPLRKSFFGSPCGAGRNVNFNWTAGCTALGRDTQVVELSNWIVKNWPVQLHVLRD